MDTNATPRRSQRIQNKAPSLSPSNSNISSNAAATTSTSPSATGPPRKMAARRSPILPTGLETILLALYPTTLVVGSLFALLDPSTRASPYNATTQSHAAASAPSYFAKKTNIFNQLFVKQGWAWITLSYFFFLFTHPTTTAESARRRGALRWALATAHWIFVTQWFFGPPIIDRSFILTGGHCERVEAKLDAERAAGADLSTKHLLTAVACKSGGGAWQGGHDISGHVFLLVLGSMFLIEEIAHVVRGKAAKDDRTITMADGGIKSATVESRGHVAGETAGQWNLSVKAVLAVAGLSWWMLLMTAAYFHTWVEKLTGLIIALSGIFLIYFLPRHIPALRDVIGMPGI